MQKEHRTKPARHLVWLTAFAVPALLVLLALGNWQLDRLAEKEDLIAHVTASIDAPPEAAPGPASWGALENDEEVLALDYRHVSITGSFLQGSAYYFTSLPERSGRYSGPGYMLYSPFQTKDGWSVLVNRGFIPQDVFRHQRSAVEEVPTGSLKLVGLLRRSETPNWTTPEADETNRIWFARDTEHMAKVLGLNPDNLAPYSIDLDAEFTGPEGLPQAGETVVRFKNDHLGYALTWFGLAATLIGVFATYSLSVLRRRP
ncbi:MAG: SURF1 family protein [Rhodobacteraceae bacterium]|nr:SURF1 family protein [Paracoccaceae bacterium]